MFNSKFNHKFLLGLLLLRHFRQQDCEEFRPRPQAPTDIQGSRLPEPPLPHGKRFHSICCVRLGSADAVRMGAATLSEDSVELRDWGAWVQRDSARTAQMPRTAVLSSTYRQRVHSKARGQA
ncbi:hypothetical protein B0H11DRAFT_1369874 [Mycena galericulata]|nr:hypothetical protein B0H11DRAFT_1369874 [Mycena galericulata]